MADKITGFCPACRTISVLRCVKCGGFELSDDEVRRNQRIVDLVTAPGSIVEPSKINPGMVVVVDGRTGLDACEQTADACFDTLFAQADSGESPGRVFLSLTGALVEAIPAVPGPSEPT